jgi:thymidylate synthase (FAD)
VSTGKEPIDADEKKITGLLDFLVEHRHGTPFEHGFVTVRVNAPIKVWREWHRHRIGMSYNEQSGRYMKLAPVFYVSPPHRPMFRNEPFRPSRPKFLTIEQATEDGFRSKPVPHGNNFDWGSDDPRTPVREGGYVSNIHNEPIDSEEHGIVWNPLDAQEAYDYYLVEMTAIYKHSYSVYERNLDLGLDPGLARDCLGVGIYSACYVSLNPRSLMNFLSLRTHEPKALKVSFPLWEIEVAARQVEDVLKTYWPLTHAAFNKTRLPVEGCLFNRYAP